MSEARNKKKKKTSWIPLIGMLIGLCVIGYYPISEMFDSWRRNQIVSQMDRPPYVTADEEKETLLLQARSYNERLAGETPELDYEAIYPYEKQLDTTGGGAFSAIIIPSISLTMPIYHGTGSEVLSAGVGHLEDTSLPIGGPSVHTVVSAHSGLAAMRAFDDIRDLKLGDLFGFRTLGDDYVYEVTEIETVLPTEMSSLAIQPGQDLATLVTCTPYGINSHRLLVHGKRVPTPENWDQPVRKPNVVRVATNRRVWPFLLACLVVLLLIVGKQVVTLRRKRKASRSSV